jgi:hypothetical protein
MSEQAMSPRRSVLKHRNIIHDIFASSTGCQYGMSVIAMAHVPCIATQVGAQLGAQIFKCVHQI